MCEQYLAPSTLVGVANAMLSEGHHPSEGESPPMPTATVTIPNAGTVTITTEDGVTVADGVAAAAAQMGVTPPDPQRVAFVQNGENVTAETPVEDQARVTAAPFVANGAS